MAPALLAVLLPALFWDRPVDTADALRKAGIERLAVPPGRQEQWRKLGFAATAFDPARATRAVAPGVEYRMDVASATRVPWVDANGWRFDRDPARPFFYDVPAGGASLAAAEAYAYGAQAAIRVTPADLQPLARMQRFLAGIGQPRLPPKANIAVVDDGSDAMAEVLNLLARHNLLFHIVPAADPRYDLNIHRVPEADNPYQFAMQTRRDLTDEKRLVRIYGSNVVLVRLTGNSRRTRVDLLNYGTAPVKGLRVRLTGAYPSGKLAAFAHPAAVLEDYTVDADVTEFSIPEIATYAVVDLAVQ